MNPQIKQYLPIAYIIGAILLLIVIASWIIAPKYGSFELHKTPFIAENFASLHDGKIYSFNGAAFYSTNPQDAKDITILSAGLKLPMAEKLYWADDKGALAVFSDTQTNGSIVEKYLMDRGLAVDGSTADYTWYVDFKTNSLHLVSDSPVDSENAYFSPETQSFYFSTFPSHEEGEDEDVYPTLWAYSIAKKENRAVVANIGSEPVRYIGPCTGKEICVIQEKDPNLQELWTPENKKKKALSNTYNSMSPTENPAIFIGEKNEAFSKEESTEDEELRAELFLLNLQGNEAKSLGIKVNTGASIAVTSYSKGKKFIVFDDSVLKGDNQSVITNVAPNLFGQMQTRHEQYKFTAKGDLSENIVSTLSQSSDGTAILGGSEGGVYLHSPSSYNYKLETYNEKALKDLSKPCLDKYTKYYQYVPEIHQTTVGILFDTEFANTVKNFTTCLAKTDKKLFLGNNYIFIGLSEDGRFVTN